ncbi:MAG: serine/threonine-protein kinase, partial [Actinomycetota bacterium]
MTDEGLATGEVIGGRWRIDRFIASGGFGQVYAASDNSSAAVGSVAVKVLLEGASTAERQGFLAEVGHMNSLHHDNLVRHIDSGLLTSSEQGAVFLVIELCQESLAEYCRRQEGGVLPPSRLAALVDDVSGGLDYLHRSGRVHRDLKPANILRSGDTWKLADFGLVRELSASGVYHVQKLVGTPLYMAPEFFNDGPVGPPSDIWSVGVLLHEILAGNRAHQGQGPAYVHALTNAEPVISPELSPAAAELVRRCLDRDPARRPTAAELPAILAGAGSSSGAVTVDAGPLAAGAAAGAVAGAASTGPAATGQVAGPSAVSPTDPLSAPTVTADAGPAPTAGVESPGGGWRRRWLIGAGALLLCALVGVGLFALLSRDDDDATDATTEAAADEAAAPTTEAATDTPDAAADD